MVEKLPTKSHTAFENNFKYHIILNEGYLSLSGPLMWLINGLNVYQLNLYHQLNFMHKLKTNQTPVIFRDSITKQHHKYSTNFSKTNYSSKQYSLTSAKFSIFFPGPKLRKDYLEKVEKELQSSFQSKIKSKYLEYEN